MMMIKANGVLGYMKGWSKEFTDSYVTKQYIYYIIYYWVWIYFFFLIYVNLIESVQKRFLLFCLRGLEWNSFVLPSYWRKLALIKLPTLLSVSFLLGLVRGDVYSDYLLRKINFNVPIRPSRNFNLLFTYLLNWP